MSSCWEMVLEKQSKADILGGKRQKCIYLIVHRIPTWWEP